LMAGSQKEEMGQAALLRPGNSHSTGSGMG
jgi:hypothetical protein